MIQPKLSLIIPAYNEAGRIEACMDNLEKFIKFQPDPIEVIFIDDGSQDSTAKIIMARMTQGKNYQLIMNGKNLGKGASVKKGMLVATGRFRLFTDTDLSTPLSNSYELLTYLESGEFDVAIGSRRVKGAHLGKRQPFLREASGRIFSLMVRLITVPGFLDTQCGFKLFTEHAAMKIFPKLQTTGFAFDVEVIYLAVKVLGLKVKEVPVHWYDSRPTKVNMLTDPIKMVLDILRIPHHRY